MRRAIPFALAALLSIALPIRAQAPPLKPPIPPAEVKAAFLKLLDRPRIPLDAKILETSKPDGGVVFENVDFATEAREDGSIERVPALIVRPDPVKAGERFPAVLVLHGTGGSKTGDLSWLEQLARRGMIAVAIDGRFHGERGRGKKGTKAYNDAIIEAWRTRPGWPQAHPFYYDTCWDVWRTLDYLQSRPDVDPDRLGLMGISKGGIETWLAGAVDPRVKVAVPAISVQSFSWGLEHEKYQARANTIKEAHEAAAADLGEKSINAKVCRALWDKVIPGILDEFDGPSMLRLFAGRPLLILNGELDPNCPLEGAEIAFASARAAFHDAGADDKLKILVAKGTAHAVTRDQRAAAVEWFATWLKASPPTAALKLDRPSRSPTIVAPGPGATSEAGVRLAGPAGGV